MNECPGADFGIPWYLNVDQGGTALRQRLLQRGAEMIRRSDPRGADAEGLRELDKIRIDQVGGHDPAVKTFALVAPHIAVSIVIEHKHDNADVELHGSSELLHAEHETAVARDRNHRPVGMGNL